MSRLPRMDYEHGVSSFVARTRDNLKLSASLQLRGGTFKSSVLSVALCAATVSCGGAASATDVASDATVLDRRTWWTRSRMRRRRLTRTTPREVEASARRDRVRLRGRNGRRSRGKRCAALECAQYSSACNVPHHVPPPSTAVSHTTHLGNDLAFVVRRSIA